MGRKKLHQPVKEVMVHCRGCYTLETVWFIGKTMVRTSKFAQRQGHVYHDCGTKIPCLLLKGS